MILGLALLQVIKIQSLAYQQQIDLLLQIRQCVDKLGQGDVQNSQCCGEPELTEECNTDSCPMWTDWSPWSQCSTSCGGGRRQRGRECAAPTFRNGQYFCEGGEDYEEEACNENVTTF